MLPETFTNLKILPKDIKKEELLTIMKSFSEALGVRCGFCHEISNEHANFAADTKKPKEIARLMMQMTWNINQNYISKIKGEKVQCATCHRGHEKPEPEKEPLRPKQK